MKLDGLDEASQNKKSLPKLDLDPQNGLQIKSLRETVFEAIREAIINGNLKPGQRLMEVQIAEQLGVSRTPVRESLRKLEHEGFVSMIPRKGAYVTPLSIDDLSDMMQIRGALEALAARLAVDNASKEQIEELKKSNALFEKAAIDNDSEGIIEHDINFHETLYKASGNERLRGMIHSLRDQMQRMRVLYVNRIEDKTPLIGQHDAIIAGIEEGEKKRAEEEAARHILTTEDDMVRVLKDIDSMNLER